MDSSITFRLDADTKKKMYEICEQLGMTPSAALNMFVMAFVRERGMPFPITLKELCTPNRETMLAIREAENGKAEGPFDSAQELMEALDGHLLKGD